MERHLTNIITTCIVGFGVWFGLLMITTAHGLLGEANETLFRMLSMTSRICGGVAAAIWLARRNRGRSMAIPDYSVLFLGALSLTYLAYLTVAS